MKPISAAILSVSGLTLSDDEKRVLEQANPVGVTLFKRNIQNKAQVKKLVYSIKEVIGRSNVFIAVDQEGGRVCRFSTPKWPEYFAQATLGTLKGKDSEEITRLHGSLIGTDLRELGVNLNYAPVLDVLYRNTTSALIGRIFSKSEKKVAKLGEILLKSYQEQGICTCIKHLPGHGRALVDPHFDLPVLTQDLSDLEKDFYPFECVGNLSPMGMTAHIILKKLDSKPVTQSKKAIQQIIRGRIGFKGFLLSDAIDMHALKGSLTEKTKASLRAGCDAVCYCAGKMDELTEVVKALSPLTDAALERLEGMNAVIKKVPSKINKKACYHRYQELAQKGQITDASHDVVETLNKNKSFR